MSFRDRVASVKQPLTEDQLLAGKLEPTNEWYAIAKIAGIKLCQAHRRQYGSDFISIMPTNLYGPGDNYHPENSHVAAALISASTKQKREMRRAQPFGEPKLRGASFYMWMISRMPVFSC